MTDAATDPAMMTDPDAEGPALPRRTEYVPLDSLKADPRNPKSHDLATIDESYGRFGVVDLITVDGRTGYIISGHGRTTTLRDAYAKGDPAPEGVVLAEDGSWLVPVNSGWASKNDAEAAAALISMNRLTEMGGWVDESLLALLQDISDAGGDFSGVGFTDTDMDDLKHLLEDVPDIDELADEWDPENVPNSGGASGVTIKLTDPGVIAAWHDLRDTFKTDDEAARSLFGLDPAPPVKKKKAPASRAADPTVDDLSPESPATPVENASPVGQGSLSQRYAAEDLNLEPGMEADPEAALEPEVAPPDDGGLDWTTASMVAVTPEDLADADAEIEIDLSDEEPS